MKIYLVLLLFNMILTQKGGGRNSGTGGTTYNGGRSTTIYTSPTRSTVYVNRQTYSPSCS
jgi:hypothetical protein